MPEGDTVRLVCARLGQALTGQVLTECQVRWGEFGSLDLRGETVIAVRAYGKHIFVDIGARTIHTHLRMDGYFLITRASEPARSDHRIRLVLGNSNWRASGYLLGMMDVITADQAARLIAHLGPDILADDYPHQGRAEICRRAQAHRDEPIGQVLLDQQVAAGIGTIYLAETLYALGISPWAPVHQVDLAAVYDTARQLMVRGLRAGRPHTTGAYRPGTAVHGKGGRPCRRCGSPIAVGTVGQPPDDRPAWYCPTCQGV